MCLIYYSLSSVNDPPPRIILPLVIRGRHFSLSLGTMKITFPLEKTSYKNYDNKKVQLGYTWFIDLYNITCIYTVYNNNYDAIASKKHWCYAEIEQSLFSCYAIVAISYVHACSVIIILACLCNLTCIPLDCSQRESLHWGMGGLHSDK